MAVDTKGLTPAIEGKTVRVWFPENEVAVIRINWVDVHDDCTICPGYAGIIYDMLETNKPERYKTNPPNSAYWADFPDIEKWELVNER